MRASSLRPWLLAALLWLPPAQAMERVDEASGLPFIAVAELPAEGRDMLRLIERGGPFPYERDGVTFRNYERVLPKQPRGYYREYTVKTPGVKHRGARRIVCGKAPARGRPMGSPLLRSDPFALPECYYTADHYRTFKRIEEQP